MLTRCILVIIVLILTGSYCPADAQGKEVFLREDFNDLDSWKPLNFSKIKEHSTYSIDRDESRNYLKAGSNASASGIVFKEEFDVFDYPLVRWRWKISNVYEKGDARKKSGDDYPLRVYIVFKYDPEKASLGQRIRYGLARKIYGEYPPHSSLNYIWSNLRHKEHVITNTYAQEAKLIILQSGAGEAGKWISQEIDILQDYQRAFGEDPPSRASIAIMNDSDNTKESSVSFVDYIEIYR